MKFILLTDHDGNATSINLKYFVRAYIHDERTIVKLIEGTCVVKESVIEIHKMISGLTT